MRCTMTTMSLQVPVALTWVCASWCGSLVILRPRLNLVVTWRCSIWIAGTTRRCRTRSSMFNGVVIVRSCLYDIASMCCMCAFWWPVSWRQVNLMISLSLCMFAFRAFSNRQEACSFFAFYTLKDVLKSCEPAGVLVRAFATILIQINNKYIFNSVMSEYYLTYYYQETAII